MTTVQAALGDAMEVCIISMDKSKKYHFVEVTIKLVDDITTDTISCTMVKEEDGTYSIFDTHVDQHVEEIYELRDGKVTKV